MGQPRKPTKLHILQGTARAAAMAKRGNEPVVETSIGECPSWMPDIGKEEWIRNTSHPVIGQLLTALHRGSFEHYCLLYQRFVDDAKGIETMKASDRQSFHSLCMQLGFTPAAQSKVSMPAPKKTESVWDKLASNQ